MSKFYELIDFKLFKGCDLKTIDNLVSSSSNRISSYNAGDIIALQASKFRSVLLLCEGSVTTLMTNAEGKEIKIETLKAPEFLAPAFVFGSENVLPVTIKAVESCKIWSISKEGFLNMLQNETVVLQNFLADISDRSLFLSRKLNEFALESLNKRVINYLKSHKIIKNVQELALILGVARPSLSRTVSALIDEGIIIKEKDGYVLA